VARGVVQCIRVKKLFIFSSKNCKWRRRSK